MRTKRKQQQQKIGEFPARMPKYEEKHLAVSSSFLYRRSSRWQHSNLITTAIFRSNVIII